jgi:hypothetical protein
LSDWLSDLFEVKITMNKNIAQDYLNAYKKEIGRLYGQQIADKSIFDYDHGWFRTGIAVKYADGSVGGASFRVISSRLSEFERMINNLKDR